MNYRDAYVRFIFADNVAGSNKAGSYVKALDYLSQMMERSALFGSSHFWSVESSEKVQQLYDYAIANQKEEGSIFLHDDFPPSYGKNRYYSAALRSYGQFLVTHQYEETLWDVYQRSEVSGVDLAQALAEHSISSVVAFEGDDLLSGRSGKDIERVVKNRLGQSFFRRMILSEYDSKCCVTGLDIPEVLRASHIASWASDKDNRLNPANGLCLSATYDAAFDRHLISFDDDYRMVLGPSLRDQYSNEAFKNYFLDFEGSQIAQPRRFWPDRSLLESHRNKLA